jgi:TolB protein
MDRPAYVRLGLFSAALLLSFTTVMSLLTSTAYASFPGTNGKILFIDDNRILAVDPDGTDLVQITNGIPNVSNPKWSHDGTKIVFDNNSDIFVLDLATGVLTNLTDDDDAASQYPSWSGDSTQIVYDRGAQVYVMDADGTDKTLVSSVSPSTTYPSWSPDGTKIAFVNGGTVAVMNPDGTDVTNLPGTALEAFFLNWSLDSAKISFGSGSSTYTVNSDGTGLAQLLDDAYYTSWSPDGTKITFAIFNGTASQSQIYTANADGTGRVNLGIEGAFPDWGVSSSIVLPPPSNDAPIVTGTVDRAPDSNGYYNQPIIITWSGSDPDGIASCDPEVSYAGPDSPPASGGDNSITFTGHCIDNVGNEGTGTVMIRYDDTRPEISSPQQGGKFIVGQDMPTDFTCTDGSSGIQACEASADEIDTSSAGSRSYTVDAVDVAGNTEQLTVGYTVFTEQTYTLSINAAPTSGSSSLHMWTAVRASNGTIVQTGFTPMTFVGNAGSTYVVTVSDYQSIKFSNWDNGSSSRHRSFTLSSDVDATAYYDTSSVQRGFTSLTYAGTAEQPDLTVNAVSLADSRTLHMWTTVQLVSSDASGTVYKVTVQDYLDRQFDHWEDGSTDRIRTLTIEEAAAITAYYNTD